LDFRTHSVMYRTFAARLIGETGRCPSDMIRPVQPYALPEFMIGDGWPVPLFTTCPTCKSEWITQTSDSSQSTEPPLASGISSTPLQPLIDPGLAFEPRPTLEPSPDLFHDIFETFFPPVKDEPPKQSARRRSTRRREEPLQVSLSDAYNLSVVPGERRSEPSGVDTYDFDNSGSSSTSVQTLIAKHSSGFVMAFETERATERNGQASVGLLNFAQVEGLLRSTLRQQHSLQSTSTLYFEHTSQINIPARTHVQVRLNWRRIWQDGVINLTTRAGVGISLPYAVTVDLTFDAKHTDVTA
jgi:hypothetical protein